MVTIPAVGEVTKLSIGSPAVAPLASPSVVAVGVPGACVGVAVAVAVAVGVAVGVPGGCVAVAVGVAVGVAVAVAVGVAVAVRVAVAVGVAVAVAVGVAAAGVAVAVAVGGPLQVNDSPGSVRSPSGGTLRALLTATCAGFNWFTVIGTLFWSWMETSLRVRLARPGALPSIVTRDRTPGPLSLGPASLTAAVNGEVRGSGLATTAVNGCDPPAARIRKLPL